MVPRAEHLLLAAVALSLISAAVGLEAHPPLAGFMEEAQRAADPVAEGAVVSAATNVAAAAAAADFEEVVEGVAAGLLRRYSPLVHQPAQILVSPIWARW